MHGVESYICTEISNPMKDSMCSRLPAAMDHNKDGLCKPGFKPIVCLFRVSAAKLQVYLMYPYSVCFFSMESWAFVPQ